MSERIEAQNHIIELQGTTTIIDGRKFVAADSLVTTHPSLGQQIWDYLQHKSWETTLAGIVASAGTFVITFPQYFAQWPIVKDVANFALMGGIAGMGIFAKSSRLGPNLPQNELPVHLQDPKVPNGSIIPKS